MGLIKKTVLAASLVGLTACVDIGSADLRGSAPEGATLVDQFVFSSTQVGVAQAIARQCPSLRIHTGQRRATKDAYVAALSNKYGNPPPAHIRQEMANKTSKITPLVTSYMNKYMDSSLPPKQRACKLGRQEIALKSPIGRLLID